jgi:hypothetical protein
METCPKNGVCVCVCVCTPVFVSVSVSKCVGYAISVRMELLRVRFAAYVRIMCVYHT